MGGDCLADIAQLRAHPQVFGPVSSDPAVSRCIDTLAADSAAALAAIHAARAAARARAWPLAGGHVPDHAVDDARLLVIDVDGTAPPSSRPAPTNGVDMLMRRPEVHGIHSTRSASSPSHRP